MKRDTLIYIVIALVIIAVVLYYVLGTASGGSALIGTTVSAEQMSELQSIALNASLAGQVGVGATSLGGVTNYPSAVNGSALVVDGKPGVVYAGAEYCPYCAVTRWGLIIALLRFGNFTGLKYMQSSSTDRYPDSYTFSFLNSSYSSSLIGFDTVEVQNRTGAALQVPDAIENATNERYNVGPKAGIPFIDFMNATVQQGATVSPQIVQSSDWSKIISGLSDPSSPFAQAIIGNANIFTATICKHGGATLSNSSVCQESYVKNIEGQIP